jgi:hypothetical protein
LNYWPKVRVSGSKAAINYGAGFATAIIVPYISKHWLILIRRVCRISWRVIPQKSGGPALERLRWRLSHVCRIQAGPFPRFIAGTLS